MQEVKPQFLFFQISNFSIDRDVDKTAQKKTQQKNQTNKKSQNNDSENYFGLSEDEDDHVYHGGNEEDEDDEMDFDIEELLKRGEIEFAEKEKIIEDRIKQFEDAKQ